MGLPFWLQPDSTKGGSLGSIIMATIGAVVLPFLIGLIKRA
ncbi:MAG: GlsB/YeaQ/YmgE family stress response membrane protein [Candidatus Competibacteraceae bacterium]|nr:GlsB/YeaQ/YmgE family stress response membrane protein [Candidatus Competibacteraceae bacterium]MBK8897090.1 GlsB/YeaQ/YmgE family stress response membrane protein [Candidatus Competibacteraceae bacterium]